MVTYIQEIIPSPTDITLLGLTFKANTDDTRESSSIAIAQMLSDLNYTLHCYDPMHSLINHDVLPKNCQLYPSANDAISASKTIVVLTEWPDFQRIKWAKLNEQHTPYTVIDLRNMFVPKPCLPMYAFTILTALSAALIQKTNSILIRFSSTFYKDLSPHDIQKIIAMASNIVSIHQTDLTNRHKNSIEAETTNWLL